MKILAVSEFDPCGVLAGHRKALRALGVDYRLAVHDVYLDKPWDAPDWHESELSPDKRDELRTFGAEADIIQFHPAIGQPWSYESDVPRFTRDAYDRPFGEIEWGEYRFSHAKKVAFFHGSRNAAANMPAYSSYYHRLGFILAASTLDYVEGLEPEELTPAQRKAGTVYYLPPIVDLRNWEPAALRQDGEPLRLIHTPTDPGFCHTAAIERVAGKLGLSLVVMTDKPHRTVLAAKQGAHAGFDHMRGSFSVNTWEHAALGLVPLVKIRESLYEWLRRHGFPEPPFPHLSNEASLENVLRELADSPELTRGYQQNAYEWATSSLWGPDSLPQYLKLQYEAMLR